jgi:hypothetical protein
MRRGGFGKTSDGRVSHTVPVTDPLAVSNKRAPARQFGARTADSASTPLISMSRIRGVSASNKATRSRSTLRCRAAGARPQLTGQSCSYLDDAETAVVRDQRVWSRLAASHLRPLIDPCSPIELPLC